MKNRQPKFLLPLLGEVLEQQHQRADDHQPADDHLQPEGRVLQADGGGGRASGRRRDDHRKHAHQQQRIEDQASTVHRGGTEHAHNPPSTEGVQEEDGVDEEGAEEESLRRLKEVLLSTFLDGPEAGDQCQAAGAEDRRVVELGAVFSEKQLTGAVKGVAEEASAASQIRHNGGSVSAIAASDANAVSPLAQAEGVGWKRCSIKTNEEE
ncbi:hypothetical protein TYRP_021060 [Tyrophagus putrescentiae]|nr:hypothetical protein TYRP_021060 [Tyrophagus putrescentiae]